MTNTSRLHWLFLANATVLITHQIDAAFWHEWELFRLPGGNQVNLLLNLPIIGLVLYAHQRVVANVQTGMFFYKLLAVLGFLTCAIHAGFMFAGNESFVQPMSLALLAATLALSVWQLLALKGIRRGTGQKSRTVSH